MLNGSIMGIPYKLDELGLLSNPAVISKLLMWVFTGSILVVLFLLRKRTGEKNESNTDSNDRAHSRVWLAKIWLVLIILGQLRSPFLPWGYGNFAMLWFTVLMIPNPGYRWWKMIRLVVFWALFAMILPLPFGPTHVTYDFLWTLVGMVAVLGVCTVTIVRHVRANTLQFNVSDSEQIRVT